MSKDFISQLDKNQMFEEISKFELQKLKRQKKICGLRHDGVGARLMCFANTIRLSKKLKKDYEFYWDTSLQSSHVGNKSKKELDQMKANKHVFDLLPNLQKKIVYFNSENEKIKSNISEWKIILIKNEDKKKVVLELKKILKNIFSNHKIRLEKGLFFDYGINIRLGDIDTLTSRKYSKEIKYNNDFNLGKFYPQIFWQKIIDKLNTKIALGCSDYKILKKNFKLNKNIYVLDKYHLNKNDFTYNYLKDILLISRANNIISGFRSGTGLILALMAKKAQTPENFLKIEEIYFEFYYVLLNEYIKYNNFYSLLKHLKNYFLFKLNTKILSFKIFVKNIF